LLAAYDRKIDKYNRDLSEWKKDSAATQPKSPAPN
jgi:hypothetical protein